VKTLLKLTRRSREARLAALIKLAKPGAAKPKPTATPQV
jgi:hypothetical protein